MKRLVLFLFLMTSGTAITADHDFHVSITKIDLNHDSKRLEIMIKLFTDDLSAALSNHFGEDVMLGTANEPPTTNDRLKNYVLERFSVSINGKNVGLSCLGKQQEEDATWIFIESEKIGKIRTMEIANPLLTDLFDDQANLVNINIDGEKKGMTLRKEEVSGTLQFN